MLIPLIPIAISLATKYAPGLIGKLAGNNAEKVAEQVIGVAQAITGTSTPQEANNIINNNPEIALKFKEAMFEYQLAIEKEDTKRLEAVNKTMVAESQSKSKWQSSWRPFNGFMFGITLFCDYFVSQLALMSFAASGISHTFVWQHIPAPVYMLWTGVLGVTAGSRGFEKVATTKALNGGQLDIMDTLKTFTKGMFNR
jgi:hypothetical protein